jgi:hypothetical protein
MYNITGWSGGDFVWGEYLSMCNAKAAPEKLFHSVSSNFLHYL